MHNSRTYLVVLVIEAFQVIPSQYVIFGMMHIRQYLMVIRQCASVDPYIRGTAKKKKSCRIPSKSHAMPSMSRNKYLDAHRVSTTHQSKTNLRDSTQMRLRMLMNGARCIYEYHPNFTRNARALPLVQTHVSTTRQLTRSPR